MSQQTAEAPPLRLPAIRLTVAGEVLALMGRNRVSQGKLAHALGISQPSLSKRLHGLVPWSIDELAVIAAFFHIPVATLITATDRPPLYQALTLPFPPGVVTPMFGRRATDRP